MSGVRSGEKGDGYPEKALGWYKDKGQSLIPMETGGTEGEPVSA